MFGLIRHKLKQPIALMLAGIVILLALNNSFFLHAHKMADGSIVYHAHPFSKHNDTNPLKTHQHGAIDMVLLNSLSLFVFALALVVAVIAIEKVRIYIPLKITGFRQDYYIHLNGRAPPSAFSFQ